jgi:hypothetical protein
MHRKLIIITTWIGHVPRNHVRRDTRRRCMPHCPEASRLFATEGSRVKEHGARIQDGMRDILSVYPAHELGKSRNKVRRRGSELQAKWGTASRSPISTTSAMMCFPGANKLVLERRLRVVSSTSGDPLAYPVLTVP